ncbi:hypothetical protein MLD38_014150 [Melastoma candidum]|uniref:Uncharacterized protein n=1 Tax=Melastoma candidum TaxID=119954 RepID=A0ACB9RB84_9MYRT|nr:hypothetical protein MLD38_014150 [Melastoma candidum]
MEGSGGEKKESMSYRYWVREATHDAAPLPLPKKISPSDPHLIGTNGNPPAPSLGSAWNSAGTWEEKCLNKWASDRIKELITSIGPMEFASGCFAEIFEVTNCTGDAFLVTVRNKKRVGYTYELKLKIKGEWTINEEKKKVKGHLDIPEFSFGELDELEMVVKLSEEKDIQHRDKHKICQDLKRFLQPVREKLLQFEQELKDR